MRVWVLFVAIILNLAFAAISAIAQAPDVDGVEQEATMKAARLQRFRDELATRSGPRAQDNYDVVYHRFHWQIDPAVNAISGAVHTYFIPDASMASLQFDLRSPLIVDSVRYHGASKAFTHSSNLISISFGPALPGNVLDSISVFYHGTPSTADDSWFFTNHAGAPLISTLSEPYGARAWWPCKQNLSDKIDSMDAIITVPTGNKAACNGVLISSVVNGGNTVYHWKHRYPIATYLVAVSVTNYAEYTDTIQIGAQVLDVLNYVYPENLATWQGQSPALRPMFRYFDSLFIAYPFMNEKYGHAQFPWGGGMEHQTMSFMFFLSPQLMIHEGAHQWFGDRVTCGSWEHIWLNEGFATYCEGLGSERGINGNNSWLAWKTGNRTRATNEAEGSVWVNDTTNVGRIFSSNLSYGKGGMLCHMLRWKLGDAAFFQGIRNYLNDPFIANGFATTSQLQAKLEAVSGQNLSDFFNDWFYGKGYPSYQIQWYQFPDNTLRIRVEQTQSSASPNVGFFNIPLEFVISNGSQRDSFILDPTYSGQVFDVPAGFTASALLLDPNIRIISKNNTVTYSSLLPFSFLDFQGQWSEEHTVDLNWSVGEEQDCAAYCVERSEEGIDFEKIASIACKGLSPSAYSWKDREAPAIVYYRILAEDLQGTKAYTKVLRLSRDSDPGLKLYPNPALNGILQLESETGIQKISVYNYLGQEVFSAAQFGKEQVFEDLSFLPAGNYRLSVDFGSGERHMLQWIN